MGRTSMADLEKTPVTDSHPVPSLVEGQGAAGPKAGSFPSLESGGRLLSFCGAMALETVFGTDRHNCVSGDGSSFWNPFQCVSKDRHQAPSPFGVFS